VLASVLLTVRRNPVLGKEGLVDFLFRSHSPTSGMNDRRGETDLVTVMGVQMDTGRTARLITCYEIFKQNFLQEILDIVGGLRPADSVPGSAVMLAVLLVIIIFTPFLLRNFSTTPVATRKASGRSNIATVDSNLFRV
jgi:hypothetical protein